MEDRGVNMDEYCSVDCGFRIADFGLRNADWVS